MASIAANTTLEKTFRTSLTMFAKRDLIATSRLLSGQAPKVSAHVAVHSGNRSHMRLPKTISKLTGPPDLNIEVDSSEEFGRIVSKRKQEPRSQNARTFLIVLGVVLFSVLAIWLVVKFGATEDSVYGESFQKLFDIKGNKNQLGQPETE